MDRSSFFIKNKAMFGSFPTQQAVEELEKEGVRFFVDLTHHNERKIVPYKTKYTYISYPIIDRNTPHNILEFILMIVRLSNIIYSLKSGELLYIHCKGGHGRSGVMVAVLLSYMFKLSPEKSLKFTAKYHSNRKVMREKWRLVGSPQTCQQKSFVFFCCKPLYFYKSSYKVGNTIGFSTFSPHPVYIKDFGVFPTSESAIQAYKDPTNKEYIKKLQNSLDPVFAKKLSKQINVRKDWSEVCYNIIYRIIKLKFEQHPYLKDVLINTKLCPLIQETSDDDYWDMGDAVKGKNLIGDILTKLRNSYYQEMLI